MHNFISSTQTDASRRNRRIAIGMMAVLLTSAVVLSAIIPQKSFAAALASATSTPSKIATVTATSTRTILLPTSTPVEIDLRNPRFLKDTSLIHIDKSCDAPCWRGITPGKTKWDDALKILKDQTGFDDIQVQSIPDAGPAVGAGWQPTGGELCCQIIADDGKTVDSIFLQIAPDITVKQLIDARGEPEYVLGTAGTATQAIINLFYPKQSIIVFAFVAGAATGELSETSEIIGVYYTTPYLMDLGIKSSSLYGWKGYQPFSAYAPDNPTADFKVTQSVPLTPSGTPHK